MTIGRALCTGARCHATRKHQSFIQILCAQSHGNQKKKKKSINIVLILKF